jgi:SAM-dependent methyltransferase
MDFNRRLSNAWFTYYQCDKCRSLLLAEPPPDLERYYPPGYYDLPTNEASLAQAAEHERYKLDIVQRFVQRGRLAEVGPGAGGFAYLAKQAGFEVETVEMDARTSEFLRAVAGVGVTNSADASAVLARSGSFDVIALWHVVEHLPDPRGTLKAAASALSPGGVLVVATPNPDSMQFRVFRAQWVHLDAPRHVQLIPAIAICEQASAWGLRPVLETTSDIGGLGWNGFGWERSIRNLASKMGRPMASDVPARIVRKLARPIERRGMNGSTYTLVLRKDAAA